MYENDEYILIDGEKRARVHPTNGVKQGCPLSPLLFSLYINDMGREISEGIEGAVTGDRVNCVSGGGSFNRSPCNFSGSVLPSGFLIACLIPTVRLYVMC